jgi:hypothetical protein|tara:strand:- start:386 stop:598 length:213 start_codon:yes stop_codon:yes gene_type:complete
MRDKDKNLAALQRSYGIKVGAFGPVLKRTTTQEVWKFAILQAIDGGYDSVSEYLVDILTDMYYEAQVEEG